MFFAPVVCPNQHQHTTPSSPTSHVLMILTDGTLAFKCHHGHCSHFDWAWYKRAAKLDDALYKEDIERLTTAQAHSFIKVKILGPVPSLAPATGEYDLRFPDAALYGRIGELSASLNAPQGLTYPAYLTAYAGRSLPPQPSSRTNLYTALLAPPSTGKTYALDHAKAEMGRFTTSPYLLPIAVFYKSVGNHEGGEFLWVNDELELLFKKIQIQGSAWAPPFAHYGAATRAAPQPRLKGRKTL